MRPVIGGSLLLLLAAPAWCAGARASGQPASTKLAEPPAGHFYHGVFPGSANGMGNDSSPAEVSSYEKAIGKRPTWVYLCHNWYEGAAFPAGQAKWARAALSDLTSGRWPRVIGFAWWNAAFKNDPVRPGARSDMRVQDSPALASILRTYVGRNGQVLSLARTAAHPGLVAASSLSRSIPPLRRSRTALRPAPLGGRPPQPAPR